MVDIFHYMKASSILRDKFNEKKVKNPSFSIRAWASQMGLQSHGSLQQILADKRTLPKKYIPLISKSLDFEVGELVYFETLVDFEKAKTQEEKNHYYGRLSQLRPSKNEVTVLEIENYKYLQNPLHSIIRTMIGRKDFVSDPAWIKQQLRIKTTENEIKEVLKRLISLELIKEEDGEFIKTNSQVCNKIDVPSKAVQEHHKNMCRVAAEQISEQSVNEREYNSFCINIDKKQMNSAKEKIRSFVKEFMDEFELDEKQAIDTYHLNVQLFSLTDSKEL